MALLKIIANNIELDFVSETLSVKRENNALIRSFKVAYNAFPFLIIENKKTKQALGTRELTSIDKTKTISVDVYENDLKYTGELQIISYLNGFRKCNLKYASPILAIMNTKIADMMPIVSVIPGETTPDSFVEESPTTFAGDSNWPTYVDTIIDKGFPEVKWNFPLMIWKYKFGEKLEADDTWFEYKNKVNFSINGIYQLNTGVYTSPSVIVVKNYNVPMPQLYLLSPLFYALQSIGFTAEGDFYTNEFIRKIMLLSFKNNICKVKLLTPATAVVFDGSWTTVLQGSLPFKRRAEEFTIANTGDYSIKLNFVIPGFAIPAAPYYTRVVVRRIMTVPFNTEVDNEILFRRKNATEDTIEGEFDMAFISGDKIRFEYYCVDAVMPNSYDLSFRLAGSDKDFQQMHPTIKTGRYCPDWTFATYLNNLKNIFNLNIDIDDLSKRLKINLNEDWITNQLPEPLRKTMAVKSYENNPIQAFLLKYENDADVALWIDNAGPVIYANQKSEYQENLETKFKFVPSENGTSVLSADLEDANGTGLLIYDEENYPYTSTSYQDKNLNINGDGGIYEVFWKKWLKFRLCASAIELEGAFTKTEINKFLTIKRIYVNNQDFVVSIMQYKETKQDNYEVSFKLESVTV